VSRHGSAAIWGPFHRLDGETQTAETMRAILLSGELWGGPPFGKSSPFPAVQAYTGGLPEGAEGFEFWAFAAPDVNSGPVAYWRRHGRQDALVRSNPEGTVAKIDILITKVSLNQLS
jgi:hypothetical protein